MDARRSRLDRHADRCSSLLLRHRRAAWGLAARRPEPLPERGRDPRGLRRPRRSRRGDRITPRRRHGQRLQRRHPRRPGRRDAWTCSPTRGFVAGAPRATPRTARGVAARPDLDRGPERPGRPAGGRAVRRRRQGRAASTRTRRGRRRSWSATASRTLAPTGRAQVAAPRGTSRSAARHSTCEPSRPGCRPVGRARATAPAGRASDTCAQPLLGLLAQPARGDDEQVVAVAQHRAPLGHQGLAVADHHERPTRPRGSRSSPTSTPCIRERRADPDLQQVGGDPLERCRLDVEVARLRAAGDPQQPGGPGQGRAGQQRVDHDQHEDEVEEPLRAVDPLGQRDGRQHDRHRTAQPRPGQEGRLAPGAASRGRGARQRPTAAGRRGQDQTPRRRPARRCAG